MAARRRSNRLSSSYPSANDGMYIYGNTVRQAQVMPERQPREVERPKREKQVSPQVKKNRRQALRMNPAYLAFLTIAAVVTLAACVWYLQLRAEVSSRSANIATLQQELVEIKEENTTRYNSIMDSVNLEEVRNKAINELGMVYASSEQVVTYQNPENDYVKQYEAIPESGALSESE